MAWLSLEESDRPERVFWTYAITALQTAVPGAGAGALSLLQSPGTPIETVLTVLLNEFAAIGAGEVHLVLDDYHLADGPGIGTGMVFLLDHLPPHLHIVISSRADPGLPLARLRARGELVEIRAGDLRFSPDEVTDYLTRVAGLDLAADEIAALEARTEGWITALQLAALSMQGRPDVAGFIRGFAGDDRYIVDYLLEEVLRRQSAPVRDFLLETSVLDRLSGELCDAVTAGPGGRAMLESLDRANLFVVPLDDRRRWYRYHHLFADVLRIHLRDERPGAVAELHRRASGWFDGAGEPAPAVRHALAAGDVGEAARLVELAVPALRRSRQEHVVRGWLDAFPDTVVRLRPVLAVGLAGALMTSGELDGVEGRLQRAEEMLDHPDAVIADRTELLRLPGMIPLYRAGLALVRGDGPATVAYAGRAVERSAADDHLTRAAASAILGLAAWGAGDLESAHRAYSAAVDGMRRIGYLADILGCSVALADIRIAQGSLGDAMRTYEQALHLTSGHSGVPLRGTADMWVGMSRIARQRNDLDAAERHLRRSAELGEHTGLPQYPYRRRVAMAEIRQARGDLAGALRLLGEARQLYVGDFLPDVRPVAAVTARVLAALGRTGEALGWAREHGLSAGDELSYRREFEHITLARVLRPEDAMLLLDRLLAAAEAGDRTGSVIEILVLQALHGHVLAPLERALMLAEPEGYVRVFVDEGPPMATLLRAVARKRGPGRYLRRLVDAFGDRPPDVIPNLVDPLSDRERDVLRLLMTDLGGPAVARELRVSVNTLRTHTRNIYAKLGVDNRRAAVRRARELGLLARR